MFDQRKPAARSRLNHHQCWTWSFYHIVDRRVSIESIGPKHIKPRATIKSNTVRPFGLFLLNEFIWKSMISIKSSITIYLAQIKKLKNTTPLIFKKRFQTNFDLKSQTFNRKTNRSEKRINM